MNTVPPLRRGQSRTEQGCLRPFDAIEIPFAIMRVRNPVRLLYGGSAWLGVLLEATSERIRRGIAELGGGRDFLVVYYSTDRAGGWQPLDCPLRTLTTLDRFGLVSWDGNTPMLRMLQVPELMRAMGLLPLRNLIGREVDRIVIRKGSVEIWRVPMVGAEAPPAIMVPWSPVLSRRDRVIAAPGELEANVRPIRAEARVRLVDGIAKARRWLEELVTGKVAETAQIAKREGCSERSVRMVLNLAFISPEIVKAAVEGTLPHGAGISHLMKGPASWKAQTELLRNTATDGQWA